MIKNENPSSGVWRIFASFETIVEVLFGEVDNFPIMFFFFFVPLISLTESFKKILLRQFKKQNLNPID